MAKRLWKKKGIFTKQDLKVYETMDCEKGESLWGEFIMVDARNSRRF